MRCDVSMQNERKYGYRITYFNHPLRRHVEIFEGTSKVNPKAWKTRGRSPTTDPNRRSEKKTLKEEV